MRRSYRWHWVPRALRSSETPLQPKQGLQEWETGWLGRRGGRSCLHPCLARAQDGDLCLRPMGFFPSLSDHLEFLLTERDMHQFLLDTNSQPGSPPVSHLSLHVDLTRPAEVLLSSASLHPGLKTKMLPRPNVPKLRHVSFVRSPPPLGTTGCSCGDASQLFLPSPGCSERVQGKRGGKGAAGAIQGLQECLHPAHAAQGCPLPLGRQKGREWELSSVATIKSKRDGATREMGRGGPMAAGAEDHLAKEHGKGLGQWQHCAGGTLLHSYGAKNPHSVPPGESFSWEGAAGRS